MNALQLSRLLMRNTGQSATDFAFSQIQAGLARIYCEPWTWNWSRTSFSFSPAVYESGVSWSWSEGDNFIQADAALTTLTPQYTGRRVKIAEHWYRCVDVAFTDNTRIYLDAALEEDGTGEDTDIQLVRDEFCVHTTKIRNVATNRYPKIQRISPDFWPRKFHHFPVEGAFPSYPVFSYMDTQEGIINPPVYEPTVTASGTGTTFEVGKYRYAYSRVDLESGHESALGPITEFDSTTTHFPSVVYGNPAGNHAEAGSSYHLRLYRSDKNPTRDDCPMFLLTSRTPATLSAYTDNRVGKAIRALPRYWSGPQTRVIVIPPPDDTFHRVTVEHIKDYGFPLLDIDDIRMGSKREVEQLLRLYFATSRDEAARESQVSQTNMALFNRHLEYLLTKDREAGDQDAGPESYDPLTPGKMPVAEYDWVDLLPSRSPVG